MEDTTSIKDLLKALQKRWALILSLTICAGLISAGISYYLLTPVYQASTQILVNQKDSEKVDLDINHLQTNVDLINTYSVIIKSPIILDKVIKKLDLSQSREDLNQQISISSQENSQVFTLTVKNTSPSDAIKIVNTLSETFQTEIQNIMNVDNVSILSKANLQDSSSPVKPNPLLNILIALVIGLIAGVGLTLLLEYMDNTLKKEQDVERTLGLPVLSSIQKITPDEERSLKNFSETKTMGSETLES